MIVEFGESRLWKTRKMENLLETSGACIIMIPAAGIDESLLRERGSKVY